MCIIRLCNHDFFRPFSDEKNSIFSKKRSLETEEIEEKKEIKKPKVKKEYLPLDGLRELLEDKISTLSRKHLEEFCIQKMCEVIGQNSELGELRHQMKAQEQMLETWRNKIISITKQCRDLEIVKCRLIQDMRNKEKEGGNVSETQPVKITRSVGLQVCLQTPNQRPRILTQPPVQQPPVPTPAELQRRKTRASLPARMPPTPPAMVQPQIRNNSPAIHTKPTPPKPIQKPPIPVQKEQSSILNKALQKPITPTTPTNVRKSTDPAPKAVIDLTDEDESTKSATVTTSVTVPSNVRIISSTPITSATPLVATSVAGPRLTYLVTNGQQPQQVMLHTFATSAAQARPGQVRNLMFKPLAPNASKLLFFLYVFYVDVN